MLWSTRIDAPDYRHVALRVAIATRNHALRARVADME